MTKPLIAFYLLRSNGRKRKQHHKAPQREPRQQSNGSQPEPTKRNFKTFFKRGNK
ncbi:hypothetical protein [Candidatus Leptofilum sp.]|uniref:hypothetical protein n=1 Tax=Candidatus Leptofilum sp. TaxID=3241576 RepID=UPI003B5CE196